MLKELQAVGNMIIIKVHYNDKVNSIHLPDATKRFVGNYWGEVVSIGPDSKKDLKIGDKVYFARHEGIRIDHDEKDYYALKDMHIAGVLYD